MESQNELPKKYDNKSIEEKWKTIWSQQDTYSPSKADENSEAFTIDTPPPTVSGKMHMGHAFSYTQGDFIARYQRMRGKKVFYPFGTDDNGIPTEHLIEKTKKVRSVTMPRSDFVQLCVDTLKDIKPEFIQAWVDLGISADFKNSYSTIEEESIRVSQEAFLDLYNKEFIYRRTTPVAWSVKSQTAISQAEFENIEKESLFNDIAFHDKDGNELVIATTRPELLGACVALCAHPNDDKYKALKGSFAKVPLFDYEVPIIYDEAVAMDKGTGLMMVCTFGDKEDVEKWMKHKLDLRILFTKYGKLTDIGGKYKDMKIEEARSAILEDLEKEGFLKNQKKIVHNVNVYDRDGQPIEFMHTPQWFVKILEHKQELIEAGNKVKWHPSHMQTRYTNWVDGLSWDWCISRQRHFGVPFPVWYEKDTGKPIVARKEDLPIDPAKEKPHWYEHPDNLIPEEDVMDTWATSSMTPQIALDRTDDKAIKEKFPMSLRMQAHDIIRTWAFYTILKSTYATSNVPWENIMVSGFVLDSKGKKMSKSKGNIIEPIAMREKYGSDAMRYGASSVKLGEDMPFMEKYLETGKKLAMKIFNASKFVHMHLEDYNEHKFNPEKLLVEDKWIVKQLENVIEKSSAYLNEYEFAKARATIEQFFWKFCDYYLEIVKDRLYKPEIYGDDSRLAAQMTLHEVLTSILKLFAPYVPFITEEVFSWKFAKQLGEESIHNARWPSTHIDLEGEEEAYEEAGEVVMHIISVARQEKNKNGKSQKHPIKKIIVPCSVHEEQKVEPFADSIKRTVSAQYLVFVRKTENDEDVIIELGEE